MGRLDFEHKPKGNLGKILKKCLTGREVSWLTFNVTTSHKNE
jgi:hypothetical protein